MDARGAQAGRPAKVAVFTTTHWSRVRAAGRPDSPGAAAAMQQLCAAYWYPVYAFVRRWGHPPEDARDLTQEFFAQLLRKNTLASAERERGRFRCFLIGVLKHFLTDAKDRASALKRGGGITRVSWESDVEARFRQEPADKASPDLLFDQRWALTVLERAAAELERTETAAGRDQAFALLRPHLTSPAEGLLAAGVAAQLKLSPAALKSTLHRLRQRFFAQVRAEVATTVANPDDLEDELRYLASIFAGNSRRP